MAISNPAVTDYARDRERARTCEVQPGTCADMTDC
jgi:hypothetical protein